MWKKPGPASAGPTVGGSGLSVPSNMSSASSGGVRTFGLQLPKSKQMGAAAPRPAVKAFSMGDEEEEEAGGANPTPVQLSAIRAKKYAREQARVLAEDPDAFSYDDLFEDANSMRKREEVAPVSRLGLSTAAASSAARAAAPAPAPAAPSRYISDLLSKSALRKMEAEAVYERNLLRERAADDALHAGKEKFMTAAFREELAKREAARAKLEEQDKRDEAAERIRSKGGVASAALALAASRNLLESTAAGGVSAVAAAPVAAAPAIAAAPALSNSSSSKHARSDADADTAPSEDSRATKRSKLEGGEGASAAGEESKDVPVPPAAAASDAASTAAGTPSDSAAPSSSSAAAAAPPAVPAVASIQSEALAAVAARLTTARNASSKAEEARARMLARKQQQQQQ